MPSSNRCPTGSFAAGRTLYGAPGLEQLPLPERESHVRPEVLVRRADEDVDVPRRDVDRPVRRVVDGIRPRERSDGVRELDDARNVGRRTDRVRGDRKRHDPRSVGELRCDVVIVEREVVGHARDVNHEPEIMRQLEPRGHVRIVVERGHDDLVARRQRPRESAAEQEVERGHALPERGLSGRAAEERRGLLVRQLHELGRPPARLVRRADVRVVLAQVARDRVDDLVGALCSSRPVEERESAVERGEARAYGGDVERGRAHRTSCPLTIQRWRGLAVSEFETKQPCSALATRSCRAAGSGAGAMSTSSVVSMATNAWSPSSRFVTVPCALPAPVDVEAAAPRRVVHAGERAAHEPGEHEVLRPTTRPLAAGRSRQARCARHPPDRP